MIRVRDGSCEVDLYDESRMLVATRELTQGDVVLLVSGGHGFRMLEDTTLLEVKQGASSLSPFQRLIASSVQEGRVRFEVLRLSAAGTLSTEGWHPRRAGRRPGSG